MHKKFDEIISALTDIANEVGHLADEIGEDDLTRAFDLLADAQDLCHDAAYTVSMALGSYSGDE